MCTVSFVPARAGFYLAMNRDESRQRVAASAPQIFRAAHGLALYPAEPGGGTWIALNDVGLCLALINFSRITASSHLEAVSRGLVIPQLLGAGCLDEVPALLKSLSLGKMKPFRLIVISHPEKRLKEFRWDTEQLRARSLTWTRRHWFSSGYDEPRAQRERGRVCLLAAKSSFGSGPDWLRLLHRSHAPVRGPFSICMHRAKAATVSYSEIAVRGTEATMNYVAGPPCGEGAPRMKKLQIRRLTGRATLLKTALP